MDARRILAIVLVAGGALGLAYGGFTYTKTTHKANIGSLHLSVDEKKHVNVPVWAGLGAVVIGGLMLVAGKPR
jgi:TRAP-type C4-dicarboxylate transport system permease small subunit